jgi:hypothetical protein
MRRFLRSLVLGLVMLLALAGAAAAQGEQRADRACVGVLVSEEARTGLLGQHVSEAARASGAVFGAHVSGLATTCELPE